MEQRLRCQTLVMCVAALFVWDAAPARGSHSLCVDAQSACFDFVDVRVSLGAGPEVIVGAQMMVTYDPAVLQLVRIRPGADCDLTSPFSLNLFNSVDEELGHAFVVMAVNPFVGQMGTSEATTAACLRFLQVGTAATDICVESGVNPYNTLLSDDEGQAVSVTNALDCPGAVAPRLSCDTVSVDLSCRCAADSPDCGVLDSDCQRGVCDQNSGLCVVEPINEGGACDDGAACTTSDQCVEGTCRGTGCDLPSLCVAAEAECEEGPGTGLVRITMGDAQPGIVGAQFSVQFDAGGLQVISAGAGADCDPDSPFDLRLTQRVDNVNGEVFLAVASDGATSATTLACITFQFTGLPDDSICLFDDVGTKVTILVNEAGEATSFINADDCASSAAPPIIACDRICTLIPAVSEWSLVVFTLALLVMGKITALSRHFPT